MFEARGARGEVCLGYRCALRLGAWSLVTRTDEALGEARTTVRAQVTWRDPFWATQAPMAVRLDLGGAWWTFRDLTISDNDSSVIIRTISEPREDV